MTQRRRFVAWALAIVGGLAAQACADSGPAGPDGDLLVVRAFLFAGEPVADIRITTTVPLVSEDTLGVPVSDATVWLERDDVRFDLIATPGVAGAYHYPGSDLVVGVGEVFELGISSGSESLSATTVVPSPPQGFTVSSDVMDVVDLTAGGFGGRGGGRGGGPGGGLAFGGLIVRWTNPERDLFFVVVDNLENVVSSSLSTDLDRQTLPRVLVEHGQKLQRTAVMGPRAYEVVGPHVILVQWPEPDARAIVEPQPTPFRLPSGHFQPLLPPDTLHTLVVHLPALDTQQVRDLAIPVPAEPARQPYHVRA